MTRSVSNELVGHLVEKSGQKPNANVVQELTPSRIKRGNVDMNKLITGIGATIDTFLLDFRDKKLYCISTVEAISDDIEGNSLGTQTEGEQWYEEDASLIVRLHSSVVTASAV